MEAGGTQEIAKSDYYTDPFVTAYSALSPVTASESMCTLL